MTESEHSFEKIGEELRQRWDRLTPIQRAEFHQQVTSMDAPPRMAPPHAEWISGAQEAPWFEDLNREYRAFEAMRPELLKTCLGLFVAVYQGKVVDKDPDERELHDRIQSEYGHQVVLVEQVTEDWPVVEVIETPFEPE